MYIFKLPDLGEGLQEAEIVEWHVKSGEDTRLIPHVRSMGTQNA